MPILFLIFFALLSCSESLIYNESTPSLSIDVAFYRSSDPYKILRTSDTLSVSDTVQMQAKISPSSDYAINYFWTIVSPDTLIKVARFYFPYELDSANGLYTFTFYAIDNLGDTLSKAVTIAVSSKQKKKKLSPPSSFQGSPTFTWECQGENLSYNFKLKSKTETLLDTTLLDTTLQESLLQWGKALPTDYYEVHLTATNIYGLKYEQEWKKDE